MNDLVRSLAPLADACWNYLIHASWQSALTGLVLLAVVALRRRWPAPLRYGLLMVALVKFLLPPFAVLPCGVFSPLAAVPAVAPANTTSNAGSNEIQAASGAQVESSLHTRVAEPPMHDPPSHIDLGKHPANPLLRASKSDAQIVERPLATALVPGGTLKTISSSEAKPVEGPARASFNWNRQKLGLIAWLAGMCLVVTWLLNQRWRLSRVLRMRVAVERQTLLERYKSLAAQLGLRRVPMFCQSVSGTVPFSCGTLVPKVVIPEHLVRELPPEQLDVVLAHELAHHRRGDLWVNAVQIAAFAVFWFHPVYWILNRSIRRVREECCDDLLLARGLIGPETCCETLLAVVRGQSRSRSFALSVSMAHPLAGRLTRLMDDSQPRRSHLSRSGWLVVLLAGALFWPGIRLGSAAPADGVSKGSLKSTKDPGGKVQHQNVTGEPKPVQPKVASPDIRMQRWISFNWKAIDCSGIVTDAQGKPIDGAQVSVIYPAEDGWRFMPSGKTSGDGRFQVHLPDRFPIRSSMEELVERLVELLEDRWNCPRMAVTATGYGPAFVSNDELSRNPQPTLSLPKDDIPIRGQLVSPDGKPLTGIQVAVGMLQCVENEQGTPLPPEVQNQAADGTTRPRHQKNWSAISDLFAPATTDRDGRFQIHGIGRERIARLLISAPAVETRWTYVATTAISTGAPDHKTFRRDGGYPAIPLSVLRGFRMWHIYRTAPTGAEGSVLGPNFVQIVNPSQPVLGVVRDSETAQPLAGVRVSSELLYSHLEGSEMSQRFDASDMSNERGEFRLTGLAKQMNEVLAEPPHASPYFNRSVSCLTAGDGTGPVHLEIKLYRGIAVTGRLLDHNGKPISGAVNYYPLVDNPHAEHFADALSVGREAWNRRPQYPSTSADARGAFQIPVLPGPGILLASPGQGGTRRALFGYRWRENRFNGSLLDENDPTVVPTLPRPISLVGCDAYKGIDPKADANSAMSSWWSTRAMSSRDACSTRPDSRWQASSRSGRPAVRFPLAEISPCVLRSWKAAVALFSSRGQETRRLRPRRRRRPESNRGQARPLRIRERPACRRQSQTDGQHGFLHRLRRSGWRAARHLPRRRAHSDRRRDSPCQMVAPIRSARS